jgi:hypothetical protein
MTVYSNPRMHAVIENWPNGGKRTTATFNIESHPTRGQRATRTTVNPKTEKPSAPKTLTYARMCRIVDGDDGKTYLLNLTSFGHLSVFQSNMQYNHESIFRSDPHYLSTRALFDVECSQ